MSALIAACLFVVMLTLYVALAIQPVTIDVNPHVALAPAAVVVTVRVQPNRENRDLIVEAEGGDYRRSDVPLDGESAPIQHLIRWSALGAGDYAVVASVVSYTALVGRASTRLIVTGR